MPPRGAAILGWYLQEPLGALMEQILCSRVAQLLRGINRNDRSGFLSLDQLRAIRSDDNGGQTEAVCFAPGVGSDGNLAATSQVPQQGALGRNANPCPG